MINVPQLNFQEIVIDLKLPVEIEGSKMIVPSSMEAFLDVTESTIISFSETGEMAQRLRALVALKGPGFNSQDRSVVTCMQVKHL